MSNPSPRKCAVCGEAAKVFVSFAASGKISTMTWCDTHAIAKGVADKLGYDLTDPGIFPSKRMKESMLRCPGCDCSQRDFERKGRWGCAVCYTTFAGLLPPLLNRMHRAVEHRGKIPRRGADPAIVRHRLALLQTDLRNAVRAEQFEGAAQTREAIEGLKAKSLAANVPFPGVVPPPAEPPAGP